MNRIEQQEFIGQIIVAFIYGAFAAILATDNLSQGIIVIATVAGLKTALHYSVRQLQPKTIRSGKEFKAQHWTEKAEKVL